MTTPSKTAAKRPKPVTSDFIMNYPNKVFITDNSEIGKLCNVNHGNLEECKDPSRQFLPSLREFFEECIEQLDPANQVEKQYRLVNQTDWDWKALRLLAKRSAFYFMQNQNVRTIPEYLEAVCGKLAKEFNMNDQQSQSQNKSSLQADGQDLDKNSPLSNENNTANQDSNDKLIDNDNENSQHGNEDETETETETVQLNDEQGNSSAVGQNEDNLNENNEQEQPESTNNISRSETPMEVVGQNEETNEDIETASLSKQVEYKKFFDNDLIDFLAENISDSDELKQIAGSLKVEDEKITLVEGQTSELKQQARKILQIWTVRLKDF